MILLHTIQIVCVHVSSNMSMIDEMCIFVNKCANCYNWMQCQEVSVLMIKEFTYVRYKCECGHYL